MGRFKRYDVETFMEELEALLKANLNTYISEMNADKEGPDLLNINDSAYYIQTLNDAVVNYDDFVFVFEDGVSTNGTGPDNLDTYTVIACVVSNFGNEQIKYAHKKMFRFREILKRILQDKQGSIGRPASIKVSSLSPFAVSLLNRSEPQMGVGVSLEVSFA